jgi:hypothetical protein
MTRALAANRRILWRRVTPLSGAGGGAAGDDGYNQPIGLQRQSHGLHMSCVGDRYLNKRLILNRVLMLNIK